MDAAELEKWRARLLERLAEDIAAAKKIGDIITQITAGHQSIAAILPELNGTETSIVAANQGKWQEFVGFLESLEVHYQTDLVSESVYAEWRKHFIRRGVSAPEVIGRLMTARAYDMRRRPAYYYALFQHLLRLLESKANEDD